MADWIFLDNHTKTRPSKSLIDQMTKGATDHWLIAPTKKMEQAIFELLGAKGYHISYSTNPHFEILFAHYMNFIRKTGRTHILAAETEIPSILEGIEELEKFEVQGKILRVNEQGYLTRKILEENLRARSSLLSISWAHPHTGIIHPIHDLIVACKEQNVQIHIDVSAAIGKLYFQLSDFDADYITFDGELLRMPMPCKVILSKTKLGPVPEKLLPILASALENAFGNIDLYAMEVGRLRDLFEKKVQEMGANIHFQDIERLPNTCVFSFDGIHGEQITAELQKLGIFAKAGKELKSSMVSVALSEETTQKEMDRTIDALQSILEKLRTKKRTFTEEDAKAKNMRLCKGTAGGECTITLALLIDEEDGVIADTTYEAFGPPTLHAACETTCKLLLRKNYLQARRLSADLIEKELSVEIEDKKLNLLIDAIDNATENCMDIPIEDIYVAPPEMGHGERTEYPGWENLSNKQKQVVIAEVMKEDIQPYVELDAGGVEVVKVEDNRITIAYSGNCTSCYSATGATLDAIGNILRHKIYPDLMVIPLIENPL